MSTEPVRSALSPRTAVPILLAIFLFSLTIDNGFKFLTVPIAKSFSLDQNQASLQATIAGIVIGIGAVVYSAIADAVPIRKLLVLAVSITAAGSIFGFVGQNSFDLVLTGRIIQSCGLAASETLYVVWVAKYFSGREQKKYLGFSTAVFQLSTLLGAVGSGFIADYIAWPAMFLIALCAILAIPFIVKTVKSDDTLTSSRVDIFGLFLIAVAATSIVLFMQAFALIWVAPTVLSLALFAWHITRHEKAIIRASFFANKAYTLTLIIVFLIYSVQLGFVAVAFPGALESVFGLNQSTASLFLIPGYVLAVTVGALSGVIAKFLSSRQTAILALSVIAASALLPALLIQTSSVVLLISMLLFPSGFALLYAPLLSNAIRDIAPEQAGVGIGFYNLTINIAVPIGIAYSSLLLNPSLRLNLTGSLAASSATAATYSSLMLILGVIAVVTLILFVVAFRKRPESRRTDSSAEVSAYETSEQ